VPNVTVHVAITMVVWPIDWQPATAHAQKLRHYWNFPNSLIRNRLACISDANVSDDIPGDKIIIVVDLVKQVYV